MKEELETDRQVYSGEQISHEDHFAYFMRAAEDHDVLTREEEIELGRHVQQGLRASQRLEVGNYKSEQEREYDELCVDGGKEAKNVFLHTNLRLVAEKALYFYMNHPKGKKYGKMDLVQEGFLGLEHAVDMFDPERGFRFYTFAEYWVRQEILRALANKARTVRIPMNVHEKMVSLRIREGRGEDDKYIIEQLGIDPDELSDLRYVRTINDRMVQLDEPASEEEGRQITKGELVEDPRGEKAFDEVIDGSEKAEDSSFSGLSRWINTLKRFVSEGDLQLLKKIADNEPIGESDKRQRSRLKSLFEHPAIRAELVCLLPNKDKDDADWRERAACIGYPEVFAHPGKHQKSEVIKICGGCAVRTQCRTFFVKKKPAKAQWSGGHTLASRRKAKSKA